MEPNKINDVGANSVRPNEKLIEKQKEFKEVCAGFEAMFITQMLREMKKTVPKSDFMGEGKGQDMMEDLMYDEYAKALGSGEGVGIANMLYQQLKDTIKVDDTGEPGA